MTPECILLIGIQAAGESTFAAERFALTHVILNLDTLRTHRREERLLLKCLEQRRGFAVEWRTVEKAGIDPRTAAATMTTRRRLQTLLELPKGADYGGHVSRPVSSAAAPPNPSSSDWFIF